MSARMNGQQTSSGDIALRTSTTSTIVGDSAFPSPVTSSFEEGQPEVLEIGGIDQTLATALVGGSSSPHQEAATTTTTPTPTSPKTTTPPTSPQVLKHSAIRVKERVAFADPPAEDVPTHPATIAAPSRFGEDFDFSSRSKIYKTTRFTGMQRRLHKIKASLVGSKLASTSTTATTADSKSPSIDYAEHRATIDAQLTALFGSYTEEPPTSPGPSGPLPPLPPTPIPSLPANHSTLEALITIHLSKLDRLRRQISDFNALISTLIQDRATLLTTPEARAVAQLVTALEMEIAETRRARNMKKMFGDFHRAELRGIAVRMVLLDEEKGLVPALPAVYGGLEGDEVWEGRFW